MNEAFYAIGFRNLRHRAGGFAHQLLQITAKRPDKVHDVIRPLQDCGKIIFFEDVAMGNLQLTKIGQRLEGIAAFWIATDNTQSCASA